PGCPVAGSGWPAVIASGSRAAVRASGSARLALGNRKPRVLMPPKSDPAIDASTAIRRMNWRRVMSASRWRRPRGVSYGFRPMDALDGGSGPPGRGRRLGSFYLCQVGTGTLLERVGGAVGG